MKEKHRIASHPAAFSFTLALLLALTTLLASSCGESSETHSLKATISAQATQLAEVAIPTVTSLASPTPPPTEAKSHAPLIPMWSVSIGNLAISSPFVIGDVIVASTPEDYTMGLSRATGEVLWTWELTDSVFAKDEMRLYMCKRVVGNRPTPRIYALDLTTGKRVWNIDIDTEEAPLRGRSLSCPDVELYDGLLYFTRGQQWSWSPTEIVAIDASSGEERWVHPLEAAGAGAGKCLEGVLFTRTGWQIVGLAPETGEILWGPIDPGIVLYSISDSLASDETVILKGIDSENHTWLVALDPKTGSQRWTFDGGGELKAFGDTLLCLTSLTEGSGGCINRLKGELKWAWERDTLGVPIGMAGDALVFSSESRELIYGVDIETGSKLWDMDLQASHSWGGASDGVAIIVSGKGYMRNPVGMYGVDVASGRRIWEVKYADLYLYPKFTDIGPFLVSKTEKGMVVDLIDPITGMTKWSEQVSGRLVSFADIGDLILIVSAIGEGPRTLSAYEKAR